MELKIGDRVLVRRKNDRDVEEDEVKEQYGDYIRWMNHYPAWRHKDDAEVIGKLPSREPKVSLRSSLILATENLDCPLLKKPCSRGCAWFASSGKTCIMLRLG